MPFLVFLKEATVLDRNQLGDLALPIFGQGVLRIDGGAIGMRYSSEKRNRSSPYLSRPPVGSGTWVVHDYCTGGRFDILASRFVREFLKIPGAILRRGRLCFNRDRVWRMHVWPIGDHRLAGSKCHRRPALIRGCRGSENDKRALLLPDQLARCPVLI